MPQFIIKSIKAVSLRSSYESWKGQKKVSPKHLHHAAWYWLGPPRCFLNMCFHWFVCWNFPAKTISLKWTFSGFSLCSSNRFLALSSENENQVAHLQLDCLSWRLFVNDVSLHLCNDVNVSRVAWKFEF